MELPIEFFYVSDKKEKLVALPVALQAEFVNYAPYKIQPFNKIFEMLGTTHPIPMELQKVNEWNHSMWDIGYRFDCKLDGWQVCSSQET